MSRLYLCHSFQGRSYLLPGVFLLSISIIYQRDGCDGTYCDIVWFKNDRNPEVEMFTTDPNVSLLQRQAGNTGSLPCTLSTWGLNATLFSIILLMQ